MFTHAYSDQVLAYLISSAPRATGEESPETGGTGVPREDTVFKTKFDVSDYSTELVRCRDARQAYLGRGTQSRAPKLEPNFANL